MILLESDGEGAFSLRKNEHKEVRSAAKKQRGLPTIFSRANLFIQKQKQLTLLLLFS